eukprot:CAMPEP_0202867360 /NCGR_PEP_ID=MMETSP1391-20130828/9267_1 /ASSEMBLY_ACC=CAM_ASM_000867 /TAXON_ID=1034604 /ORGANISM="Chlamydomonas leiostraca, Strain SAG 11-49" /LENGTH=287 /DNA_ID=CAMNT_0049547399 /DNA_START=64 /DNA_END=927 /DNA_ORIENTATION=-
MKPFQSYSRSILGQRRAAQCIGRVHARLVINAAHKPSVVLTREKGKNGKMMKALGKLNMDCIELPLIEHTDGPDKARLPDALKAGGFDWVAVTSPEAAAVFLEGWEAAGKPQVRVAVVGGGTGEVLAAAGVTPAFTSSKALGKTMGSELPHVPGGSGVVLYPASAKASTDLQDSLTASGFSVNRIHTYSTTGVKAADVPKDVMAAALAADIVTFGSPSAVKAWVALVGKEVADKKPSVCIGSTSARACEAAGLTHILYPDAPGIDGWVGCVVQAAEQLQQKKAVAHS